MGSEMVGRVADALSNEMFGNNMWYKLARTAMEALPSDPRYEVSEVEGRFYVLRRGTDSVVAEFTDAAALSSAGEEWK